MAGDESTSTAASGNIDVTTLINLLQQMQRTQQNNHPDNIDLHLDSFNESAESFTVYIQRLENYLLMKNVASDERKVQVLINCIGTKHCQLLSSLTAPGLPNTKTYDEICQILKKHLCPAPNEITEQHKFLLRVQHEGESIASYVAELKRMSTSCNFICSSCNASTMDTHIRSQFIRGVRDSDVRQRLLESTQNSMDDILKIALAMETSKLESKCMQEVRQVNTNAASSSNLTWRNNPSQSHTTNKSDAKCFCCGKKGHLANECRSKDKLKCNNCNKTGHIAKVCMKKSTNTNTSNNRNRNTNIRTANTLQLDPTNNSNDDYTISSIQLQQPHVRGKLYIAVIIEGVQHTMEFDTGAAISTIGEKLFREKLPNIRMFPTHVQLKTYNGQVFPAKGAAKVSVTYDGETAIGNLYVVNDNCDSVLGREWIHALGLFRSFKINSLSAYNTNKIDELKNTIFTKNCSRTKLVRYRISPGRLNCVKAYHRYTSNLDRFHTQSSL